MANLDSIPLQDGYETTLTQELDSSSLTIYVAETPEFTFPVGKTTRLTLNPGKSNAEVVEIESYDAVAKTITIASGGRNVDQGASVTTTAQTHTVGSTVIISDNYAFWSEIQTIINSRAALDGDNTWTGTNTFTDDVSFTGATTDMKVPVKTTAEREAGGTKGDIAFDDDDGNFYMYKSSWEVIDTGTPTSNASETVSGKVQIATNAELGTSTSTGSTGARLVAPVDQIVKASSGAGDENKIAVLNDSGQFADGFIGNINGLTATVSELNQVCDGVGATVTTANLDTLTDTSNADALHGHNIFELSSSSTKRSVYLPVMTSNIQLSGTTNQSGETYTLASTTTQGSFANLYSTLFKDYTGGTIGMSQNPKFEIALRQTNPTGNIVGFGFYKNNGVPSGGFGNPSNLTEKAIFWINDGSLFAAVADGVAGAISDEITGYTLTDVNTYRIETDGSHFMFYVNDTLEWTSSTNEPTNDLKYALAGIHATDSGGDGIVDFTDFSYSYDK